MDCENNLITIKLTQSEYEAVFDSVKGKYYKLKRFKEAKKPKELWKRYEAYKSAYEKMESK